MLSDPFLLPSKGGISISNAHRLWLEEIAEVNLTGTRRTAKQCSGDFGGHFPHVRPTQPKSSMLRLRDAFLLLCLLMHRAARTTQPSGSRITWCCFQWNFWSVRIVYLGTLPSSAQGTMWQWWVSNLLLPHTKHAPTLSAVFLLPPTEFWLNLHVLILEAQSSWTKKKNRCKKQFNTELLSWS